MYPFRKSHGERLRGDFAAGVASERALVVRTSMAAGDWMMDVESVCQPMFLSSRNQLRTWHVISDDGATGDTVLNARQLLVLERVCRCFQAQHIRSMWIWTGGFYNLGGLLDTARPGVVQATMDRQKQLRPRLLALQELVANTDAESPEGRELAKFSAQYFWDESQFYFEASTRDITLPPVAPTRTPAYTIDMQQV